jgi:DNA primase
VITIWGVPIVATVEQVLRDIKLQLYGTGLLREINNTGSDLMVTCPFHKGGKEHSPSCGVLLKEKVVRDRKYEAGTVHCYTCGYTADLPQFVADVLGLENNLAGYKWLVGRYNYSSQDREPLELNLYRGQAQKASYMDEDEVERYHRELLNSEEACEYLHKRKLANWILDAYQLGYDPADKTVLFPVRDMEGRVVFYKGRSITGKHFYNAKDVDKSSLVFGLYEVCNGSFSQGIATPESEIWITESEIDALSLISYGLYAVAIMGSHISEEQCKELERSPFRRFVIATDNDDAGRKGASQIKRLLIPKGFRFTNLQWHTDLKDINDLVKQYGGNWRDYLTGY